MARWKVTYEQDVEAENVVEAATVAGESINCDPPPILRVTDEQGRSEDVDLEIIYQQEEEG